MEEDDVARQAIGAVRFDRTVENGENSVERLVITKMPMSAHDALLEEERAIAGAFHFGIVVGFQGKDIDAAEAFDKRFRNVAKVGSEADTVAVAGDEEAVGTFLVMGEGKSFNTNA